MRENFKRTADSVYLLKEENMHLAEEINLVKKQLSDLEQHTLTAKEDVIAILGAIANSLEINLYSSHISATHHLQSRRGDTRPPSIVVYFVSRLVKAGWLAAKRKRGL